MRIKNIEQIDNKGLLFAAASGPLLMFAGDMLLYGTLKSGALVQSTMAHELATVAPWRLHLGAVLGPIAAVLYAFGFVPIWRGLQSAGPRTRVVFGAGAVGMLAFAGAFHAAFGVFGDALRENAVRAGESAEGQAFLTTLIDGTATHLMVGYLVCHAVWWAAWQIALWRGRTTPATGLPGAWSRWWALWNPLTALVFVQLTALLPAPLGGPIAGGAWNLYYLAFFVALARHAGRAPRGEALTLEARGQAANPRECRWAPGGAVLR